METKNRVLIWDQCQANNKTTSTSANLSSPVWCGACVPRWAFRHALSTVDDEAVEVWEVDLGAKLGTDAAPALELVGAGRAVGHAAALVVVMHTCSTGCVTAWDCAAAKTLRVAALAVSCARSPCTFLWTFWWGDREGERKYHTSAGQPKHVFFSHTGCYIFFLQHN